ncbi:formate dehydrogenase accessory sulfurtransferase FdhD [Pseudovibrio sp. Tun.PSC04-5.I4]|uniref:formate dehydrogenase accessory sulfurtransferase FdhD n=1 Tax=Pseudovibrio sp. Tun.PSC04-5.I4 TaxID=1798213 RepID=UPI00088B4CC8|nr:formate dehydrogenase accessory sulfurtransferase FdhD [Pseudovibrio sp. Tun.PSC04-5.I4]SDQ79170.1 FdhD protein [Pseudovibrio sp. Tun.PSC04-5.I4]
MAVLDPEWQTPIDESRKLPPEAPVAITLNGEGFAVFMATPLDLEDFAVGFTISESIVSGASDIHSIGLHEHGEEGLSVNLDIEDDLFFTALKRKRMLTGTSGCGLCGLDSIRAALRALTPLTPQPAPKTDRISACFEDLQSKQSLNEVYGGGLHAAAVCCGGQILAVREDIGRHNAMDKALGAGIRSAERVDLVITTSRCSSDLVQKAVSARVGTLAVMATPSDLAVKLARENCLNLFSCNRGYSFTRYS